MSFGVKAGLEKINGFKLSKCLSINSVERVVFRAKHSQFPILMREFPKMEFPKMEQSSIRNNRRSCCSLNSEKSPAHISQ